MSVLLADSVTIVRAPFVVDKYGNQSTVRDWVHAVRTPVLRVNVQPDTSTEDTGDRAVTVTGWKLSTDRGQDINLLATDRVEWQGLTLEVDGEVGRYRMAGRVHHVEARLKKVTG